MEEFELSVEYKGQVHNFPTRLVTQGYLHKIHVTVFDQEMIFEPDEERNYRAIINQDNSQKEPDIELLKLLVEQLDTISK